MIGESLVRAPILRLWGHVVVPIQGDFKDDEAEVLCSSILQHVERRGARSLIVDISGIWLVDSHFCSVIVRLARGARLMGTPTVLAGLSPEIAATIETMGLELDLERTALNLEDALESVGIGISGIEEVDPIATLREFLTPAEAIAPWPRALGARTGAAGARETRPPEEPVR